MDSYYVMVPLPFDPNWKKSMTCPTLTTMPASKDEIIEYLEDEVKAYKAAFEKLKDYYGDAYLDAAMTLEEYLLQSDCNVIRY